MKLILLLLTFAFAAYAKRVAPPAIPPLKHDGVTYSIAKSTERSSYERSLVADRKGKTLWKTTLYKHAYDPKMETDVQTVEIASWSIDHGKVIVRDERANEYVVDAKTGRLISPEPPQSGLALTEVVKGSVYERMGLRAGDRLISVNGKTFDQKTDLPALIKAGGPMNLEIVRDRHVEILALDLEAAK